MSLSSDFTILLILSHMLLRTFHSENLLTAKPEILLGFGSLLVSAPWHCIACSLCGIGVVFPQKPSPHQEDPAPSRVKQSWHGMTSGILLTAGYLSPARCDCIYVDRGFILGCLAQRVLTNACFPALLFASFQWFILVFIHVGKWYFRGFHIKQVLRALSFPKA